MGFTFVVVHPRITSGLHPGYPVWYRAISSSLDCNSIGDLAAAIYQCAKGPGEAEELVVSGSNLSELTESFKIKLVKLPRARILPRYYLLVTILKCE